MKLLSHKFVFYVWYTTKHLQTYRKWKETERARVQPLKMGQSLLHWYALRIYTGMKPKTFIKVDLTETLIHCGSNICSASACTSLKIIIYWSWLLFLATSQIPEIQIYCFLLCDIVFLWSITGYFSSLPSLSMSNMC